MQLQLLLVICLGNVVKHSEPRTLFSNAVAPTADEALHFEERNIPTVGLGATLQHSEKSSRVCVHIVTQSLQPLLSEA